MRASPCSRAFRSRCFPDAGDADWDDWRWQLQHQICRREQLEALFPLTAEEREALDRGRDRLPLGLTPYYASLIDPEDSADPLRRTMIPTTREFVHAPGEQADPLGEEAHTPVPGLVHTYPDKALWLVTDRCATYCRFCTRSRRVGGEGSLANRDAWEGALAYLRAHTEIRDVLLSGGDPLVLADERLAWLLDQLQAIPHVELVRVGTKLPAVLPQRITPALVDCLRRHPALWVSAHFTHPHEWTPEVEAACARLVDAGIPMVSQTVLLKGVNDDADVLKHLFLALLRGRVKPYYLHQLDPVLGSSHFKTPVRTGLEILQHLHGFISGLAVPTYMLDAPGGGGKIPLTPGYLDGRDGDDLLLHNYRGEPYRYRDPE